MTDTTITHDKLTELAQQVDDYDDDTLFELLAVLADDVNRTITEDVSLASPEFQAVYDDVLTDERVLRDERELEFHLTDAVDESASESISLALLEGEMEFDDLREQPQTAVQSADLSSWVRAGKKLYRRFAAKFRENVCSDPSVSGSLDRTQLIAAIAAIIVGALVAPVYAPLVLIVATVIVNTGLDTYCPD